MPEKEKKLIYELLKSEFENRGTESGQTHYKLSDKKLILKFLNVLQIQYLNVLNINFLTDAL